MNRTFLSLLVALAGSASAAPLVFGASAEPVSLESGNVSDGNSIYVQRQIYDRLVNFREGTTRPVPGLALSWSSNRDGTSWTFKLRPGVKFHDGTGFNADAVLFNVNRWWDKKDPTNFGRPFEIWGQLMGGYKGEKSSVLRDVVKIDASTVRFDLNTPNSVFPHLIASGYFGIASPKAVREQGAKYGLPGSTPVGTGPFVFVSWKTGDRITLRPAAEHWDGPSNVSELVFRFLPDATARLQSLRAGSIDIAADLTPDAVFNVLRDKSLKLYPRPSFNVGLLSMNTKNPYLKNRKVRQAIAMAIDKKAIVQTHWSGMGVSDASFVPPTLDWANSPKVPADYRFDPAAAKKLLADAGYPNGFSLDLWYMPVSRPYFPTPKPIAQSIAEDLAAVGIKVNLRTEDWGKYLEDRNTEPGFDMYMIGWTGDYADPDNFYSAYYGPTASDDVNWRPAELDRLLAEGRSALGEDAKARVYQQIHELTYNAAVRLPVVHSQPIAATRTAVQGWVPSPLGSETLNKVRVVGKP